MWPLMYGRHTHYLGSQWWIQRFRYGRKSWKIEARGKMGLEGHYLGYDGQSAVFQANYVLKTRHVSTLHNVCAVHQGVSWVQRGDTMSTLGDTMMSVVDIMSTPRNVQYAGASIQIQLFSQRPSPTFTTISPGVLMISSQCTEHPHCTRDIPHCTHDIPHCTRDIPRCTGHPPLYCISPVVLHRHYAGW